MTKRAIELPKCYTGFSSEIGTKLRDWALGQAGAGCYSQAALSSNDSKTRYMKRLCRPGFKRVPSVGSRAAVLC